MVRKTRAVAFITAFLAVLPAAQSTTAAAPRDAVTAVVDEALAAAHGAVRVIVTKTAGSGDAAERAVREHGGSVTLDLSLVNGFAATVDASAVSALAATRGVRTISLDRKMNVQGTATSPSLPSVFAKATRADDVYKTGNTGQGVVVALLDTGIAPMADLAGRVLPVETSPLGTTAPCVNLSGELGCGDSYGHGTFLAGLIAGSGAASAGAYKGVAPGAKLVSVKVAGRNGAADVSNVIAGIQWVVSFREKYGIRILNLSLGTDSTQSYRVDPLNFAVQRAWASGLVVVVSASNRGPDAGTISKPGDDPFVITVGAVDDKGTSGLGDDRLPNFSSRGPTAADGIAKPDIVAPGARLVSLNAPGSAIAENFPSNMPAPYRRGSGTSMSAAVTSGAVALMLAAQPNLTPDRVKFMLTATARPVASSDPMAVGSGMVTVDEALAAPAGLANQGVERGTGLGSLELSRGTVHVAVDDLQQTIVYGATTAQLLLWDPTAFVAGEWDGVSWYGVSWYQNQWYGVSWYGVSWYGVSWYGSSYYGEVDGVSWYGVSWYGGAWYGVWE